MQDLLDSIPTATGRLPEADRQAPLVPYLREEPDGLEGGPAPAPSAPPAPSPRPSNASFPLPSEDLNYLQEDVIAGLAERWSRRGGRIQDLKIDQKLMQAFLDI